MRKKTNIKCIYSARTTIFFFLFFSLMNPFSWGMVKILNKVINETLVFYIYFNALKHIIYIETTTPTACLVFDICWIFAPEIAVSLTICNFTVRAFQREREWTILLFFRKMWSKCFKREKINAEKVTYIWTGN